MSQQELLSHAVRALDASGCQYMITGSFASSLHGEPRLTHDIDLVVVIPAEAIDKLAGHFPAPEYYLDRDQMKTAVRELTMFSVLHAAEGDKVDFWMLTSDPFDKSRFGRKIREEVLGMDLSVSTPEDTILVKLRWAKLSGGSEKQFRDALRIYEVQRDDLDVQYLEGWVKTLGVDADWERMLREAVN
jgi:hypothetical protein